jgi:hypothetical protein
MNQSRKLYNLTLAWSRYTQYSQPSQSQDLSVPTLLE